jgi:hypothetical protein
MADQQLKIRLDAVDNTQRAFNLAIVFKNLFENLKDVADLLATDGGFSTSFKELLKSFGELLTTLAPVIAILGKLLNLVTEIANVGLVLLNNSLKLVLGTLDKVVQELGKVVGYGSGIPQTMGLMKIEQSLQKLNKLK